MTLTVVYKIYKTLCSSYKSENSTLYIPIVITHLLDNKKNYLSDSTLKAPFIGIIGRFLKILKVFISRIFFNHLLLQTFLLDMAYK